MHDGASPAGRNFDRHAMSKLTIVCRCCVEDGVPKRSFAVTLVVGTVLNLINQGDALLAGEAIDPIKIVLTFAVPYCVATYGAVSLRLRAFDTERSGT